MEKFIENGAYNNITNQVINLLKSNLSTNSSEHFEGWCEDGDIFREESTDIQSMNYIKKEVNALVDKLEELRQFNETFKECVKLFNLKTIEELNEMLKENKSMVGHKVNKDTIKIAYNGIVVTLVNSVTFLGELLVVQEDYKIIDYYN